MRKTETRGRFRIITDPKPSPCSTPACETPDAPRSASSEKVSRKGMEEGLEEKGKLGSGRGERVMRPRSGVSVSGRMSPRVGVSGRMSPRVGVSGRMSPGVGVSGSVNPGVLRLLREEMKREAECFQDGRGPALTKKASSMKVVLEDMIGGLPPEAVEEGSAMRLDTTARMALKARKLQAKRRGLVGRESTEEKH